MHDIDGSDAEFADEGAVQITDLDPIDSPQRKRAARIAGVRSRKLTLGLAGFFKGASEFRGCDGGGAEFADGYAGCGVGEDGGVGKRRTCG